MEPGLDDAQLPSVTSEGERKIVLAELQQILESAAFRNAKRSQAFLSFVVTSTLDGNSDLLKERTIGAEVFHKPVDYDTADNSVVRVKASELRRRLAQYYVDSGPDHEVVIALPVGSYVPEFQWKAEPPAPDPPTPSAIPQPSRRWRVWIAAFVCLCLCVGIAGLWSRSARGPGSTLERFWQPVLEDTRPVLLCVANPIVFYVHSPYGELLAKGGADVPQAIPSKSVRLSTSYIGFGDAFALAGVAEFLGARHKPVEIRRGNFVSFDDLRSSPTVLIGALTNPWTIELMKNARFVFEYKNGVSMIRDTRSQRHWDEGTVANADFALVSRIFDSRTGEVVITAAGLTHLGTEIAGAFLTSPEIAEKVLGNAPRGWTQRSIQLILQGEIIGNAAGPPRVVESWFW